MAYNTIAKILKINCRQTTKKYVPAHSMWLNTVFADLANTDERHCLPIDCSGVHKNGPGTYRTEADDPEKQVCYFNKPHCDELYNVFISNRIKTENFSNCIYFKVDQVQRKDETFDAGETLNKMAHMIDFQNLTQMQSQQQSFMEKAENKDMKKLLSTLTKGLESQLDPVSFRMITTLKKNNNEI